MESDQDLIDVAKNVLATNDRGAYTQPALGLYPHQWLWDSCFVAIGLRNYDVERAKIEIRSLLRGQWRNGMIPNMIIKSAKQVPKDSYLHGGSIWRSWLNPNSPDGVSTSGITQPPMLAEAIVRIGQKMDKVERRSWYKQMYASLLKYHEWLYSERDPHNEGLILLIHPWETGLDNNPAWMSELNGHLLPAWVRFMRASKLEKVVGWFRADRKYVAEQMRMTNVEALALFDVQMRLRRKNYEFSRIIDHALFVIEDLNFNSIFIRANEHLKEIASFIGQKLPAELLENMERTEKALDELWDESSGQYFSRDFVSHRPLKESSIATLLPLYAGCITKDRAKRLVSLLENEHSFGPPFPVPSTPLDSSWFDRKRYWQGPTWVNTNWLIIDGLERYGFKDHAEALRESTLEMVSKGGCSEYFDPITGEPEGASDFSWTAALAIDLALKK